jgi:myo-inositol-1(or 4)-monophosphatase
LPASELLSAQTASAYLRDRERLAGAVREAGAIALGFFRGPLKSWTKGLGDSPVTEADIASNDLLYQRLVDSGDGWLSEESENDPGRLSAPRVWVVDPIDGTRAFIAGREDWSVSAALVVGGRPVAAALYAPVSDELFLAVAGEGATLNGAPISVTSGDLTGARIGGPKRVLDRMTLDGTGIVAMPRIHSLALRLARVAHGALDAAMAGGNGHDWDLAAADLLVHEAGGVMTGLDCMTLVYNRPEPVHGVLIAAGRERHAVLVDCMRAQTENPR